MKYTLSILLTSIIALVAFVQFLVRRKQNKPPKPPDRRVSLILFVLILIIGMAVRIYRFGQVPAGLFFDEAAVGYNIYSLLHYGIDMNGFHNPVEFVSFGSGVQALYGYLSMLFIALLGLNPLSTRLVNLLLGILSLPILYLLVRRLDDEWTALAAMFLLAINPWHVMMSRWGLDCNPFPAVFLLATYLLVCSFKKKWFFLPAMFLYGLSFYAYGTAYFSVTVFLALAIIYILRHKTKQPKLILGGLAIFILTNLPNLLYVAVNVFGWQSIDLSWISIPRLQGEARYTQVSIFYAEGGILNNLIYNVNQLIELLVTQQERWIWNAIPQFGEIYLFSGPLVLLGLGVLIAEQFKKPAPEDRIMLFWLAASLFLGLISPANVNRLNIIFIPLVYMIGKGLVFIFRQFKVLAWVLVLLYLIWFALFSQAYFTTYAEEVGSVFYESLDEAINYAADNTEGTITITTNQLHMPFVYVLYYRQIDPHEYLQSVVYYNPEATFRDVASFGRYRFREAASMPKDEGAYIVEHRELKYFDQSQFETRRFKYYSVLIPKE